MNEFLKDEVRTLLEHAASTADIIPIDDLIDLAVDEAEERVHQLETDLSNLSFATQSLNRRFVENHDHVTSMY